MTQLVVNDDIVMTHFVISNELMRMHFIISEDLRSHTEQCDDNPLSPKEWPGEHPD